MNIKTHRPRFQKIVFLTVFALSILATSHAQISNLVGNWKLDNNANDVSGNNYTGTLMGSPTFTSSPIEGTNALVLNGSNQYVDLGNPSLFPVGTSARTISAWAKTNNVTSGYQWIFAYGTASSSQAMFIGAGNNTLIGGSYANDASVTNFWAVGVWHHVCLTYDGTTAKLYADGVLKTSYVPSPAWNLVANKAYIGRQVNSNEYWNGTIDDVRIYSKALSASEVAAIATTPPSVPTNVTATTASSSSINLTWNDNSGNESGFQIERSLSTGTGLSIINTTQPNKTSYSDAALAAGTKYYYRILAVNSGGNLKYSSEANATTSGSLITAPSNLAANVSALTTVNLTWIDNSPNETGFVVEQAIGSGSYSVVTTTAANAISYAITGLLENTAYSFRVSATNATGSSVPSNVITATTSAVPPAAPTGLTVSLMNGTTINLNWTDNATNETGFQVERSVTSGIGYTPFPVTAANVTTYSDATTQEGTTYFYRVKAVNNGGASSYTPEVSISTAVGGLLGQWKLNNNGNDASGNNLNGTLTNSPTFSTDSKEGAQSLVLNGTSQYVNLTNTANLAALPGGLSARTLCAWAKTSATDNTQRSLATWGINITTNAMYIGQMGTSLVAGGFGDDFTVTNAWDGAWHHVCLTYNGTTAVLYFDGVQKASGAKSWSLNKTYAYIGRLFSDFENLWKGQIDDVRIYNKALTASEVQAIITAGPIGPTALTAIPTSASTMNLTWTDNSSNETGFLIERSTTSGTGYSQVGTVLANVTTFKDVSLTVGTNYYYRVRAYNAGGNSIYTPEYSTSIPATPPVAQGLVWDDVEFNALKDLFTSTNGASWTTKTNWPTTWPATATSAQFATWFGVTVTNGDVTSIDLSNNNLSGTLLPSVGLFNKLTSFNIRTNQISGTIPAEINNLTSLTFLSLGPNQFTGDIPNLGSLVNLTSFEISVVPVNPGPIPSWISNFTNLQALNLTNSKRTGTIPAFVWSLTNLKTLYLDTNQLTGTIPTTIGSLVNLTSLTISGNQLTGNIPTEMGNLINLVAIELVGNNLTESIPSSFGNLNKLMYLYLSNNSLTGSVPQEIRNCVALRELIVGHNQLNGISDLSNIVGLNYIGLDHNQFTGPVPEWMGHVNDLWHLFLDDNQFNGSLPASIGTLPNLLNLIVNNNQLTGAFPDVANAIKLQNISANANSFTSMPTGILGLTHLTTVNFDNNNLTSIPDFSVQSNKANLLLTVSNNYLDFSSLEPLITGGLRGIAYAPQKNIHDFISAGYANGGSLIIQSRNPGLHSTILWEKQQTNSSWLNVNASNQDGTQKTFTKTIPSATDNGVYHWSMTNSSVTGLTLQSDPITVENGGVPDAIEFAALKDIYNSLGGTNWTNKTNWPTTWPASATSAEFGTWYGITVTNGDISSIKLSDNNLIGTIPSSIGNLQALKNFSVHVNKGITGEIPVSLANVSVLEDLYLYQCNLTGTIPSEIFTLPSLTFLGLEGNQLSGTIPSNIGDARSLYNLGLGGNNLTGSIPTSLSNLINLVGLSLSNNKLTGTIPPWIGNLVHLSNLDLSTNQFTGPIPDELYNLTELTNLGITSTQVSGSLSPLIGNLVNLQYLNVTHNQLSGPLPSELGNLLNLRILILDSNQFSGTIPSTLGNLSDIQTLTLSSNQLSGPIPSSFGNLSNLSYADLSNNQLSGLIPEAISGLTNIRYLYLFKNNFSGALPTTLGGLTSLAYFRADYNQFTGSLPDLSALPILDQLIITNNNFSGPLIGARLPNTIVDFQIRGNQFSGVFPDISQWSRLSSLAIENNQFTGAFPSVAGLTQLKYITASNNGFTSLPSSLLNLSGLYWAEFFNNNLTSLPDFTTHPNKANLSLLVQNNYLDFSQLEPLTNAGIKSVSDLPQKNIHDIINLQYIVGQGINIPSRNPGQHSTITWEKQQGNGSWSNVNSLDQDATLQTFDKASGAASDVGIYRWSMVNSLVTGFTLQSDPISVSTPVPPVTSTAYNASWTDFQNSKLNVDNTITKTAISSSWDASVVSSNAILPLTDGWIKFNSIASPNVATIGLSRVNSLADVSSIDYGFQFIGINVYIYESGVSKTVSRGSAYVISRQGSFINYYIDGVPVHTTTTDPSYTLILDTSIQNGSLPVVSISVPTTPRTYYAIANGLWTDPRVWSLSEGGPAATLYPGNADTAIVKGFTVTVGSGIYNSGINVIVNNPTTSVKVDGSNGLLNVTGKIKIVGESEANASTAVIVSNNAALNVQ